MIPSSYFWHYMMGSQEIAVLTGYTVMAVHGGIQVHLTKLYKL